MSGRIVTIGLTVATVGSVLVWAVTTLPQGVRPASGTAGTDKAAVGQSVRVENERFSVETGSWTVRGRVLGQGSGKFDVELRILDKNGWPVTEDLGIRLALTMPEHSMPPIEAAVRRSGPGEYRAVRDVSMYGRWRARFTLPDGAFDVLLDIGF